MSQPKKHRSRINIGESYRKRAARAHCQVIASVNVQSYCEKQQVCGRTCTESSQIPSCLPAGHACWCCFRVITCSTIKSGTRAAALCTLRPRKPLKVKLCHTVGVIYCGTAMDQGCASRSTQTPHLSHT